MEYLVQIINQIFYQIYINPIYSAYFAISLLFAFWGILRLIHFLFTWHFDYYQHETKIYLFILFVIPTLMTESWFILETIKAKAYLQVNVINQVQQYISEGRCNISQLNQTEADKLTALKFDPKQPFFIRKYGFDFNFQSIDIAGCIFNTGFSVPMNRIVCTYTNLSLCDERRLTYSWREKQKEPQFNWDSLYKITLPQKFLEQLKQI